MNVVGTARVTGPARRRQRDAQRALAPLECETAAATLDDQSHGVAADVVTRPFVLGAGVGQADDEQRARAARVGRARESAEAPRRTTPWLRSSPPAALATGVVRPGA